jgi:hypothetical protein
MLDLIFFLVASIPIATGLAFVLLAHRNRRGTASVRAHSVEPERR